MKTRVYKIIMSSILVLMTLFCSVSEELSAKAAELYDYSAIFSLGNGKISADNGVYCCGFSGTTGYGAEAFPSGSYYTVSCNYRIFASCAAAGRYYYFTEVYPGFSDCNIVVYDSNTGLTDTFAVTNLYVTSNDMVAADSYGNIYFVPSDSGSTVKCFAVSGRPCAEFSFGGSVRKLMTVGNGYVMAVCSNGNYLINSSGYNSFVGGSGDIYSSGNGCLSDGYGNVYDLHMNLIYSGGKASAKLSKGYVRYDSGELIVTDTSGKDIAKADCIDGVSRIYAMGDTVVAYNGGSGFSVYFGGDFYQIPQETTEPPTTQEITEEITEEITRPTEPTASTGEEPSQTDNQQQEEGFVYSQVYTLDSEKKYVLNVSPATNQKTFLGNFVMSNAKYALERNNTSLSYIANGDRITFYVNDKEYVYRIVVNRDFNCDGMFNSEDIESMAYLLLGGGSIQQWQLLSSDTDGDGDIGLDDLYQNFLDS